MEKGLGAMYAEIRLLNSTKDYYQFVQVLLPEIDPR